MSLPIVLSLVLAPQAAPAAPESRRPLADAPRFVAEAKAFAGSLLAKVDLVPSLGIAVVVDDQVVLAEGFGLADRERGLKADGDTLYYIASATKPFTALMASILDARGEIELGDALADHLDDGQLAPELQADQILLRDLLCHTSGLDNGPIAFRLAYSGDHDAETLWRLIGATSANEAGRGRFQYTNYGYNLLTILLERELGQRWQDLLQDELFGPLGLAHTSAYVSLPREKGLTLAAPYRVHPDGLRRGALEKRDEQMQSAGGMLTSPRDAARWLLFQLHHGVLDGRAVVDPRIVRETQREWTRIEGEARAHDGATACGAGWMIGTHADPRLYHHEGGYPGFRATLSFQPDARVGVAVLMNGEAGETVDIVRAWAYDWWLNRDTSDAAARIERLATSGDAARARLAQMVAEHSAREWQLSKGHAAYAGSYVNERLGTLTVEEAGKSIRVRLGLLECLAQPYPQADSMRFELIPGSGAVAQFELDETGRARRLSYQGETFERRAD